MSLARILELVQMFTNLDAPEHSHKHDQELDVPEHASEQDVPECAFELDVPEHV